MVSKSRAHGDFRRVMPRGSTRTSSKATYTENINSIETLLEMLKTSLGPSGLDKVIIDEDGIIWVVNDGFNILNKLKIQHRAAELLVQTTKGIHEEIGDGTISTVLLVGNFLRETEDLINIRKIHPLILADGCMNASKRSLEFLNDLAIPVDENDETTLCHVAETALGKLPTKEKKHLSKLIVKSVLTTANKVGDEFEIDLNNVDVRKCIGESIIESKLISGFAFFREMPYIMHDMPKQLENARILAIKGEIRIKQKAFKLTKHLVSINDPGDIRRAYDEEDAILNNYLNKILDVGANVIVVEKGIDPQLFPHFSKYGIFPIRRVVIEDLEKISKAVGAKIVAIEYATPQDLGKAKLIEWKKINGRPWIFIEGFSNPKSVTLLLRSEIEHELNAIERLTHKALYAIRNVLLKKKIVPGGGATEMELARLLGRWALTLPIREQLAVKSFANAFESFVIQLAENSGLKPLDTLIKLRSHHSNGEKWTGIDTYTREIGNAVEKKIFEPLLVKEQVIKSASETAATILRINEVIKMKQLKGEEYHEKKREEATRPERVKKIHREYDVDGPYT